VQQAARNNTSRHLVGLMEGAEAQQAMQDNISTMHAAVKSLEPGNPEQQQATAQNLLTFMEVHLTLLDEYLAAAAAAAAAAADSQGSVATAVAQIMQDKVIKLRQHDFQSA